MTVIKTRVIESALTSKGFRVSQTDHKYYYFYVEGKRTNIWTKISHGLDEYGDDLLRLMKKQLKLEKQELVEFISCSLSEAEYRNQLVRKGIKF